LGATREDRQPEAQQQVLQDIEIPLDRLPADLALPGDIAEVQHAGVGKTHRL
jgi:hypothetical protein